MKTIYCYFKEKTQYMAKKEILGTIHKNILHMLAKSC